MQRSTALSAIFFLSIIGLAIAGYQTYEHYYMGASPCDISQTFSCSTVTNSIYGEFPPASGIATSAWGMVWWVAVLVLSGSLLSGKPLFDREWQEFAMFAAAAFGIVFAAYLVTVELYLLPQRIGHIAICLFCTVQHAFILILGYLSYTLLSQPVRSYLP